MSNSQVECFLLGAGASKQAGIPTSIEMTSAVIGVVESQGDQSAEAAAALYYALGGLMFGRGQRGLRPEDVDIEALMEALDLLSSREESELAPFVSAWNEPKARRESFVGRALSLAARSAVLGSRNMSPTFFDEDQFFDEVVKAAGGPILHYDLARRKVLAVLRNIVWATDPDRFLYLGPLIRIAAEQNAAIATLNYDNGIELAARAGGISVSDGFAIGTSAGLPDFSDGQLRLIKLHGSIDWTYSGVEQRTQFEEAEILKVENPMEHKSTHWPYEYEPALLLGGRNKLTARGPFLDLLSAFRSALEGSKRLTILGYSFRDEHVNHIIGSGSTQRRTSESAL
ncbi:MAG: SIR2 family protein [Actinobacteria bacterium]|nr:SIR2 family protein [Actinomycetota bacterium]MCI0679030.1 SIR2 family protein [Actinomycetota bacterium]